MEDDALLLCLEELLLAGDDGPDDANTGREEEKRSMGSTKDAAIAEDDATTQTAATSGRLGPHGEARGSDDLLELEKENARLREALEEAEARMTRANRVLRNLAGGRSGDGEVGGGDSEDEEGSVAGVRDWIGCFSVLFVR